MNLINLFFGGKKRKNKKRKTRKRNGGELGVDNSVAPGGICKRRGFMKKGTDCKAGQTKPDFSGKIFTTPYECIKGICKEKESKGQKAANIMWGMRDFKFGGKKRKNKKRKTRRRKRGGEGCDNFSGVTKKIRTRLKNPIPCAQPAILPEMWLDVPVEYEKGKQYGGRRRRKSRKRKTKRRRKRR